MTCSAYRSLCLMLWIDIPKIEPSPLTSNALNQKRSIKKVPLAATISANTTTVVTKTLLDDAQYVFE
uniref:Uncharacterized protein n=1 Tax=Tanacetum cinerariifolium TaxID=118510 RepID=A0A6L2J2K8_TANCI|nr:hypothetical protein [Tanacetum cinerariifolium]